VFTVVSTERQSDLLLLMDDDITCGLTMGFLEQSKNYQSNLVSQVKFLCILLVCLLLNSTSALYRPSVPRIVEVEYMSHVKNDL